METYVIDFQALQQQLLLAEQQSFWVTERFHAGMNNIFLYQFVALTWNMVEEAVALFCSREYVWEEVDLCKKRSLQSASILMTWTMHPPTLKRFATPAAPVIPAAMSRNLTPLRDPNTMDVDRAC